MTRPSELLVAAKELLSDPACWTQKVMARTKHGMEVDPTSSLACSWCVAGSLYGLAKTDIAAREKALEFLRRATKFFGGHGSVGSPPMINDRGQHGLVMLLLDKAIELANLAEGSGSVA